MKTIDDKQLDGLISDSLQRQHTIESINTQVLAEVKRHNRRRIAKQILRLITVAFGVPTMLAVMGYGAYRLVMMSGGAFGYIAAAIAIISAVAMTTYSLAFFSFDEV